MSAIKIAIVRYLDALELTPKFTDVAPPASQVGAVARSAAPCPVRYRRKAP